MKEKIFMFLVGLMATCSLALHFMSPAGIISVAGIFQQTPAEAIPADQGVSRIIQPQAVTPFVLDNPKITRCGDRFSQSEFPDGTGNTRKVIFFNNKSSYNATKIPDAFVAYKDQIKTIIAGRNGAFGVEVLILKGRPTFVIYITEGEYEKSANCIPEPTTKPGVEIKMG